MVPFAYTPLAFVATLFVPLDPLALERVVPLVAATVAADARATGIAADPALSVRYQHDRVLVVVLST